MGGGFKTEIEGLEYAADRALRPLAEELRAARVQITATSRFDGAFDGPLCEEGLSAWQETRGFLERVFDDNAENLDLAARALREIAARYRAADEQGANAMHTIARDGLS